MFPTARRIRRSSYVAGEGGTFECRLRVVENAPQTFGRFLLNDAAFELAERSDQAVSSRTVLIDKVRRWPSHRHKSRQRQRRVEIMICVNLFGDGEQLRPEFAIAFINGDVVDRDYGLESKLDLVPNEQFFDWLQLGTRTRGARKIVQITGNAAERLVLLSHTDFVLLVVVRDQRCVATRAVVVDILE